jgi:hypothetical protein
MGTNDSKGRVKSVGRREWRGEGGMEVEKG